GVDGEQVMEGTAASPTARGAALMLPALAGLAFTAPAASAQVDWTTQVRFAQTIAGPTIPGNTFQGTATGTYTFIVRVGIFDLTGLSPGQANHGLARWTPTITVTGLESGESVSFTGAPRPAPYNVGPPPPPPNLPIDPAVVDFRRDLTGVASAPW